MVPLRRPCSRIAMRFGSGRDAARGSPPRPTTLCQQRELKHCRHALWHPGGRRRRLPAMTDVLENIIAYKLKEIADAAARQPLAAVEVAAHKAPPVRGFAAALNAKIAAGEPALIAEI